MLGEEHAFGVNPFCPSLHPSVSERIVSTSHMTNSPTPRTSLSKKERRRRERWARDGYGRAPLCYLCQQNPATTDDHCPPKALLATTRGANAYFLPSCRPCNAMLRDEEEYLRNVLASVGYTPDARQALQDTLRSLRDDSPLYPFNRRAQLYRGLTVRDIHSPRGIWLGRGTTFDVSTERLDPVLAKIVRGLHYQQCKSPLPLDTMYEVLPFASLDSQSVAELITEFSRFPRYAGEEIPGVLTYLAWEVQGLESAVWVLQFYRSMSFVVFANSPALIAEQEAHENGLVIRPHSDCAGDGEET
jgi:hypothetical protein